MNISKKPPVRVAIAKYQPTGIPDYDNNPLILAIPPRIEPRRMKQLLTISVPTFDSSGLSRNEREERVREIRKTRILSNQHLDLYDDLYDMLRYGYVHRNPLLPEVVAWSYDIADPNIPLEDVNKPVLVNATARPTTSDAIFLTGFSGNGKSTITELLLYNLFPQALEHNYEGFDEPQVVYLKVDLPHNALRTGLIHRLIKELDRVLTKTSFGNPNYAETVKTKAGKYIDVESMMDILVTVLTRHHVGLIVIDEFQNLQVASRDSRLETIQLFDELANRLYIPSVKIGTPDALLMFDRNSRHGRRLGETFELERLSEEKVWERAMKALFQFQPLTYPIERSKAIEDLLLQLTAAIPDYLVKLWEASLVEAIRSGKEKLSQALIKKAFRQRFPLLRSATRNINLGKKGRYADLLTVQQYLDLGRKATALKHLNQMANKIDAEGLAAEDILTDINDSIETVNFTQAECKKLNKIKAKLQEKKQQQLGPQTLGHEKC